MDNSCRSGTENYLVSDILRFTRNVRETIPLLGGWILDDYRRTIYRWEFKSLLQHGGEFTVILVKTE